MNPLLRRTPQSEIKIKVDASVLRIFAQFQTLSARNRPVFLIRFGSERCVKPSHCGVVSQYEILLIAALRSTTLAVTLLTPSSIAGQRGLTGSGSTGR
jgi:hypothetical protein